MTGSPVVSSVVVVVVVAVPVIDARPNHDDRPVMVMMVAAVVPAVRVTRAPVRVPGVVVAVLGAAGGAVLVTLPAAPVPARRVTIGTAAAALVVVGQRGRGERPQGRDGGDQQRRTGTGDCRTPGDKTHKLLLAIEGVRDRGGPRTRPGLGTPGDSPS